MIIDIPRDPGYIWPDDSPKRPENEIKASDAIKAAWDAAVKEADTKCKPPTCCKEVKIEVKCDSDMRAVMKRIEKDWCGKKETVPCK